MQSTNNPIKGCPKIMLSGNHLTPSAKKEVSEDGDRDRDGIDVLTKALQRFSLKNGSGHLNVIKVMDAKALSASIILKASLVVEFDKPQSFKSILGDFHEQLSTPIMAMMLLNHMTSYEKEYIAAQQKNGEAQTSNEFKLFIQIYHYLYLVSLQYPEQKLHSEEILCHFWRALNSGFFDLKEKILNTQQPDDLLEHYKNAQKYHSLINLYYPQYKKNLDYILLNKPGEHAQVYLKQLHRGLFQVHANLIDVEINSAYFFYQQGFHYDALQALYRSRMHLALLKAQLDPILIASFEHLSDEEQISQREIKLTTLESITTYVDKIAQGISSNQEYGTVIPFGTILDNCLIRLLAIADETQQFCASLTNFPSEKIITDSSADEEINNLQQNIQFLANILSERRKKTLSLEARLDTTYDKELELTHEMYVELNLYRNHAKKDELIKEAMRLCLIWRALFDTNDTPIACGPIQETLNSIFNQFKNMLTKAEPIKREVIEMPVITQRHINDVVLLTQKIKRIETADIEKAKDLIAEYQDRLMDAHFFKFALTSLIESIYARMPAHPAVNAEQLKLLEFNFFLQQSRLLHFVCEYLFSVPFTLPTLEQSDRLTRFLGQFSLEMKEAPHLLLLTLWPGLDAMLAYQYKRYNNNSPDKQEVIANLKKFKNLSDYYYPRCFALANAALQDNTENYSENLIIVQKKSLWYIFYLFANIEIDYCIYLFENNQIEQAKRSFKQCQVKYLQFKNNFENILAKSQINLSTAPKNLTQLTIKFMAVENLNKPKIAIPVKPTKTQSRTKGKTKLNGCEKTEPVLPQQIEIANRIAQELIEQEQTEALLRQQEQKERKQKAIIKRAKSLEADKLKKQVPIVLEQQPLIQNEEPCKKTELKKEPQKHDKIVQEQLKKETAHNKKPSRKKKKKKKKVNTLPILENSHQQTQEQLQKTEQVVELNRLEEERKLQEVCLLEETRKLEARLFEETKQQEARLIEEAKQQAAALVQKNQRILDLKKNHIKFIRGMLLIKHELKLPDNVKEILQKLEDEGYFALVTGGYPRDCLLNIEYNDFDIITNCPDERMLSVLKELGCFENKKRTGLFHVPGIKTDISSSTSKTLMEEINKRDLRINAMFWDKKDNIYGHRKVLEELADPYFTLIGNVDSRFNSDPSKILRLIYYRDKIGKKLKPHYINAMVNHAPMILSTMKLGIYNSNINRIFFNGDNLNSLWFLVRFKILPHLVVFKPSDEITELLAMRVYKPSPLYQFWQFQLQQMKLAPRQYGVNHIIAMLLMPIAIDHPVFETNSAKVIDEVVNTFFANFKDPEEAELVENMCIEVTKLIPHCLNCYAIFVNPPLYEAPSQNVLASPARSLTPAFSAQLESNSKEINACNEIESTLCSVAIAPCSGLFT